MESTLSWEDATAQAGLVRSGQVSARELVADAIERVERCDPVVNAVIHQRFEAALDEASGELPPGPFTGVPLLVKDLGGAQAGEPYCEGTGFAKAAGYRAARDSYIVEDFLRAGFVVLGRTNCPELGTSITTEPAAFGATRNPWNTEYSPGGSSGGAAAAVSSGMVPVAHATDGGGSIRIPSSWCGLFGLKPTRGRVSRGPEPSESWMGFSVAHVVTRTVRDSASVLDAVSSRRPGELFSAPPPARPFAKEPGSDPGRLRIGVMEQPGLDAFSTDPECVRAVAEAGKVLEALGHVVEPAHPEALGDGAFQRHFLTVVATAVAADLTRWSAALGREVDPSEYEPLNELFTSIGRSVSGPDYVETLLWLEGYRRRVARFWSEDGFDLLLTPVTARPPARLGELSDPDHGQERVVATLQFTGQFNVTGQPAVSLPMHWTATGLPVGVQLVAAFGREDVLLQVSAQVEQARPWADRRPAVHA